MAKSRSTKPKNKIVKQPKLLKSDAKLRKKPKYKSFRLHKRIKHHAPKVPSWWMLFKKSLALMRANKKAIFVFFIIYGVLNLLLVRGFESPLNVDELQETFYELLGEETSSFATGLTSFGLLVQASTQGSGEVAQVYQTFLLIIASLALIWLYRQQQAGNKVSMKMAFYRGMYPFIPFVLVLLVVFLQFVPALVGNFMYTTVVQNGLIVGALEHIVWVLLLIFTLLLSLYMLCSSTMALYIVTLPEMTPITALREARELVRYRRFSILRKILAIILIIFALLFVVVLPIIFFAPTLAEWMFFAITVLGVPLVHGYMFSLYRELL